ncbi:hypothetical protein MTO96_013909 [Rhipicephalus appendiculatus]
MLRPGRPPQPPPASDPRRPRVQLRSDLAPPREAPRASPPPLLAAARSTTPGTAAAQKKASTRRKAVRVVDGIPKRKLDGG